jgi:NTE family protein
LVPDSQFPPDGFLHYLVEQINMTEFEELKIPLRVVATDFYSGEPVVFDSGPLLPALKASMSIPGVFVPVEHDGKILVDGGMSNNLPYDLLPESCEVTIAVDVSPTRIKEDTEPPSMIDATLGMFDILMERVTKAMLEKHPPTLYFRPRIVDIRVLEFDKADEVFKQVGDGLAEFKVRIEETVNSPSLRAEGGLAKAPLSG